MKWRLFTSKDHFQSGETLNAAWKYSLPVSFMHIHLMGDCAGNGWIYCMLTVITLHCNHHANVIQPIFYFKKSHRQQKRKEREGTLL